MSKHFEKIKTGLEEAIAHKKGKITLRTEIIDIPEPPADYSAKEIRTLPVSTP
jgi:putative transcriptional regulator